MLCNNGSIPTKTRFIWTHIKRLLFVQHVTCYISTQNSFDLDECQNVLAILPRRTCAGTCRKHHSIACLNGPSNLVEGRPPLWGVSGGSQHVPEPSKHLVARICLFCPPSVFLLPGSSFILPSSSFLLLPPWFRGGQRARPQALQRCLWGPGEPVLALAESIIA